MVLNANSVSLNACHPVCCCIAVGSVKFSPRVAVLCVTVFNSCVSLTGLLCGAGALEKVAQLSGGAEAVDMVLAASKSGSALQHTFPVRLV